MEMKLAHWWNYEEGVAGERQANREDPWAEETQAGCSQEEGKNERGVGVKSGRGFDDSSDPVLNSQKRGGPQSLPLCAPLLSRPEPEPEPKPEPEPSQPGAAAPVAAAGASHLPTVEDNMLEPSSVPFSPDEDRRLPVFP